MAPLIPPDAARQMRAAVFDRLVVQTSAAPVQNLIEGFVLAVSPVVWFATSLGDFDPVGTITSPLDSRRPPRISNRETHARVGSAGSEEGVRCGVVWCVCGGGHCHAHRSKKTKPPQLLQRSPTLALALAQQRPTASAVVITTAGPNGAVDATHELFKAFQIGVANPRPSMLYALS